VFVCDTDILNLIITPAIFWVSLCGVRFVGIKCQSLVLVLFVSSNRFSILSGFVRLFVMVDIRSFVYSIIFDLIRFDLDFGFPL